MQLLSALIPLVLATQVLGASNPLEGRTLVTPQWDAEVTPGGEKVLLSGTIQEVHARLLELNPNYDQDFPLKQPTSPTLDKRTFFPADVRCDCQGRLAVIPSSGNGETALLRDIQMLRDIRNKIPTAPKGPGYCSRVSCSSGAAITWCNDDPKGKTLASFGSVADGAQFIWGRCRTAGGVSGQVFHPTNWNVIVDKQKC
ncbi:hypothetical protein V500_05618 [Pseudogymnoascus sp. VKM F-4518 (FW-2643)]|nr:hypothetical protein V500_05618 [Pseudogymnoascus sp. VKM F-4518 (FW-2643)]